MSANPASPLPDSPSLLKMLDEVERLAIHLDKIMEGSGADDVYRKIEDQLFDVRSAIELSFATLTETARKYEMLCRAVNDNSGECSASCNSYGHAADCEYVEMAPSLRIQQEKIAVLLSENERLRATALTPEEASFLLDQGFDHMSSFAQSLGAKLRLISGRALSGETPK